MTKKPKIWIWIYVTKNLGGGGKKMRGVILCVQGWQNHTVVLWSSSLEVIWNNKQINVKEEWKKVCVPHSLIPLFGARLSISSKKRMEGADARAFRGSQKHAKQRNRNGFLFRSRRVKSHFLKHFPYVLLRLSYVHVQQLRTLDGQKSQPAFCCHGLRCVTNFCW